MGDLDLAIETIETVNVLAAPDEDAPSSLARTVIEYRVRRKRSPESPGLDDLRRQMLSKARRLPRTRFEERPALLRDLAAEVAGEDLQIATEALRLVGLGELENSTIDLLAAGLDAWDKDLGKVTGKPGSVLLQGARVEGEGFKAWEVWLSSQPRIELAREIRTLLFEYPQASTPVLEALQQVYQAAQELSPSVGE